MEDPLVYLSAKCPYNPGQILACVRGSMYFGLMLKDGRIGVCSTLHHKLESDPLLIPRIDLSREDHRIYQLAFANASLNYNSGYSASGDIFQLVDFTKSSLTAMVGYFPPLVKKFRDSGLKLKVFDLHKTYDDSDPLDEFDTSVAAAEFLVISATTLINNSLSKILTLADPKSSKFILGPSTPLLEELKTQYGFRQLFGMVFDAYEFGVLDLIGHGEGTQKFGTFGNKVMI